LTRGAEPPEVAATGLQAAIIGGAIRFRGALVALSFVLLGYGTYSVTEARYDVFPEFAPPQVGIQTEAPGLAAEEIEALVTQPIENAITGAAGVQTLRSSSIQGLSVVTATFDPRSDIFRDRQVVAGGSPTPPRSCRKVAGLRSSPP
jgi:Cu/Ag efflux pump CusA